VTESHPVCHCYRINTAPPDGSTSRAMIELSWRVTSEIGFYYHTVSGAPHMGGWQCG